MRSSPQTASSPQVYLTSFSRIPCDAPRTLLPRSLFSWVSVHAWLVRACVYIYLYSHLWMVLCFETISLCSVSDLRRPPYPHLPCTVAVKEDLVPSCPSITVDWCRELVSTTSLVQQVWWGASLKLQVALKSTSPIFLSFPPWCPKNSPSNQCTRTICKCACVNCGDTSVHLHAFSFMGGALFWNCFSVLADRFQWAPLPPPAKHHCCEGRADEVALLLVRSVVKLSCVPVIPYIEVWW